MKNSQLSWVAILLLLPLGRQRERRILIGRQRQPQEGGKERHGLYMSEAQLRQRGLPSGEVGKPDDLYKA